MYSVGTKEALCLAVAALVLSGCASPSSYWTLIKQCQCREGAEPAVVSGEPAPRRGGPAREARARPARTAVQETRRRAFTTDPSAYPPIPVFDSPEGQRERQQSERLNKQLDEALKNVCRGC
ncbi:MAG: hypothetical protein ACJ8EA_05700 [Xanthobacteraceae bacterium]